MAPSDGIQAVNGATYALLEAGADGTVLSCSDNLTGLLASIGVDLDLVRSGTTLAALNEEVADSPAAQMFGSLVEDIESDYDQLSRDIVFPDGTTLDCTYLRHDDEVRQFIWIFRDVTQERSEQDRLRFQSEVLARVSDAVITVDANMAISYWNNGAEALTGFTAEAALGKGPEDLFQFRFPTSEEEHMAWAAIGERGSWSGELIIRTAQSDRDRYVSTSASILHDESGEFAGLLAVVRDETERREMEDKLIHHAFHDLLTGLPNRMMLLRTLDGVTSDEHSDDPAYAVLFLDLDRFKMVNDSLGHHAGDALLKSLALRLTDCVRENDIVARLGGDEFAILLNEIHGLEDAREVADRIMTSLAEPFIIEGLEIFSSASIGIVLGDVHYDLAEDLLRDADTAMYQAKRAGRSCIAVFDQTQQMQASAMFRIESDLRRAIDRDELRVHYQPVVDLASGTLHGFEALIRWQHSHRGLITPDQFLPVAEETELIVELDRWVWREVVRQLAEWRIRFGDDLSLSVSVNCSDRSLRRKDVTAFVGSLLSDFDLPAESLAIEVTERVVIEHTEPAARVLGSLREMGVHLALDDFGTGHASLSVLHALPVSILKIDRSFVKRMDRQVEGEEMVRTVVALARSLGLECVAEGIELRRQVDQLRAMSCSYGQGYLFSKPLDASMTGALIARRSEWLRQIWPEKATARGGMA